MCSREVIDSADLSVRHGDPPGGLHDPMEVTSLEIRTHMHHSTQSGAECRKYR